MWERTEKAVEGKKKGTREEGNKGRNKEVQEREQMSTFVVLCLYSSYQIWYTVFGLDFLRAILDGT
jgi:hypothetical protein